MRCPICKKTLELTNGDQARAGDYCVCKKCGAVLRFLNVVTPVLFEPVSHREIAQLQTEHPQVHRQILQAMLAAGKVPHHMRVLLDEGKIPDKTSTIIPREE